jgi:hypothetical protein
MKLILTLAASALMLAVLLPTDAEAQRRGYRAGGYGAVSARRVAVAGRRYHRYGGVGARGIAVRAPHYRRAYYRRGYRRAGLAAGALAVGATAAAAPYYYGGYAGNTCLRQQQVWNGYGYQWQTVRIC